MLAHEVWWRDDRFEADDSRNGRENEEMENEFEVCKVTRGMFETRG